MFYRPEDGHGLPHNPFNAIVTPRPIGWISTRGRMGDNLAPYSFFNAVAYVPPQVMFSSTWSKEDRGDTKDTVAQLREHGEFCVNIVEFAMRDKMNTTAGLWEAGTDEFALAGIDKAECETIDCPRVANAPASLECKVVQTLQLPGESNFATFGEVTGIHMRDDCLVDGRFDITRFHPLTRLGYRDYSAIREVFSLKRPGE
ncbi:flavin reductase family protein [Salipiger aestuarii]|uniref:Flavin reductase (DIM6/NTAB) family NADH-FMN oxidoreductase RutF n=1 Tax=Salipiger aestuarii TaxID=568098 RepID=A0A327YIG1_9RHOB|nr:flavin reductase family protein [Salipiger aestuarii]EIE50458.1 flavin reductase-like, FMN-binding protein [Citreicella sp. 357]RAK20808.1 flavin reductase (DIM6/NTAB) family NADH-FMN oxidoreductase RutF [Salipiger aestuarii]